jgi:dTDP-4-dehydrorhamnose reductase
MKIVLIGADGQLGSELRQAFSDHELVALARADLDLTDTSRVAETLRAHRPDLVLNTAAYHRVDECEDFPERSFAVNALAVRELSMISGEIGAALVHFSTDYVFDGRQRRPYREVDPPGPLSVYAASKLAGEYFVRGLVERHYVVRTCGLYGLAGARRKNGNFVETMLRLAREGREIRVVGDQVVTPTSAKELARKVRQLAETGRYGLYHITNGGECSWYEFAAAIFELSGLRPSLTETTSAAYGARARRPPYSVLDRHHLRQIGLDDMRSWRDALASYLEERNRAGPPRDL